jgi:hypothetical protein
MASLPTELILACLEHVYYSVPPYIPQKSSLIACSLVARSWTALAQELLFRSIKGHKIIQALKAKEHNQRALHLCAHVVKCEVDVDEHGLSFVQPGDLAVLFGALHRLYELSLRVNQPRELDSGTMEELQSAMKSGCRPRALNFMASGGVQSLVLYQLLDLWPTIRHLRIGCEIRAPPPWALQIKLSLYELSMFRMTSLQQFNWLLSDAIASGLQILELRDAPGPSVNGFMAPDLTFVRSLRIWHLNHGSSWFISKCSNLEELVVYHVPRVIPLNHRKMPLTIEHLSFRNPEWGFSESLGPFIDVVPLLPKLRLVSCDHTSTRAVDFHRLQSVCSDRSIVLNSDAPPPWMVSAICTRAALSKF